MDVMLPLQYVAEDFEVQIRKSEDHDSKELAFDFTCCEITPFCLKTEKLHYVHICMYPFVHLSIIFYINCSFSSKVVFYL